MQIAIVGNDAKFCLELQDLVEGQGHRALLLSDPGKAFARICEGPSRLVVIAALPSKDAALELVRTLRGHAATRTVPILHVNARGAPREVVELLDAGADDYLAKPFNGEIFLARVRTLLRRQLWSGALPAETPATTLRAGPLVVQLVERRVLAGGAECVLTRLEFDLLTHLVRHKDKVHKRSELLEAVWKYPEEVETRTLDKHVETLRRKLGEAGKLIQTIHGVGYRFLDPDGPLVENGRPGR